MSKAEPPGVVVGPEGVVVGGQLFTSMMSSGSNEPSGRGDPGNGKRISPGNQNPMST